MVKLDWPLPVFPSTKAFCLLLLSFFPAFAPSALSRSVVIDFFYEEGCRECARVKEEVLPLLEGAYAGSYTLNHSDASVRVCRMLGIETALQLQNEIGPLEFSSLAAK